MLVNQDVVMMRDKVNKGKKIHTKGMLSAELRLKTVADTTYIRECFVLQHTSTEVGNKTQADL